MLVTIIIFFLILFVGIPLLQGIGEMGKTVASGKPLLTDEEKRRARTFTPPTLKSYQVVYADQEIEVSQTSSGKHARLKLKDVDTEFMDMDEVDELGEELTRRITPLGLKSQFGILPEKIEYLDRRGRTIERVYMQNRPYGL